MTDCDVHDQRIERLERMLLHARAGVARCAQESSHESLVASWNREIRRVRLTDIARVTARPMRTKNWGSIVHTVHGEQITTRESVSAVLRSHPESLLLVRKGLALNPANIRTLKPVPGGRVMLLMFGSDEPIALVYRGAATVRRWWTDEDKRPRAFHPAEIRKPSHPDHRGRT